MVGASETVQCFRIESEEVSDGMVSLLGFSWCEAEAFFGEQEDAVGVCGGKFHVVGGE